MSDANRAGALLETEKGYYYGTEVDGSWWKRYWRDGWLSRGNAVVWVASDGVYFRRYFSKRVMRIPAASIVGITIGSKHAGRWFGAVTLKVQWRMDDKLLSSGFVVAKTEEETNKWASVIRGLMTARD